MVLGLSLSYYHYYYFFPSVLSAIKLLKQERRTKFLIGTLEPFEANLKKKVYVCVCLYIRYAFLFTNLHGSFLLCMCVFVRVYVCV